MSTVRSLLQTKGHQVWTVSPDTTVLDALRLMADKNIGAVVVADTQVVGIFSERDYARRVGVAGLSAQDTPIRDVMTRRVLYVQPDQTIEECMALMTDKRLRHLPVLENTQLVGVVSIGDVIKTVLAEREFMIEQLESYIRA